MQAANFYGRPSTALGVHELADYRGVNIAAVLGPDPPGMVAELPEQFRIGASFVLGLDTCAAKYFDFFGRRPSFTVVASSLVRIGKDTVGHLESLESSLSPGIAWVQVWVVTAA